MQLRSLLYYDYVPITAIVVFTEDANVLCNFESMLMDGVESTCGLTNGTEDSDVASEDWVPSIASENVPDLDYNLESGD